ncbi:MAG TPA: DUF5916 domain-containing protein [Bacteroidota bacterium]|nr:DUF5916 domain-containing protein [Bacteroidota bacterium]
MLKVCIFGLFAINVSARAESDALVVPDTSKPVIRAVRIEGDIPLTGTLDDPRWNQAQPVSIRYEIQPGENTPAPQTTTVRILYNSECVYYGFDCGDTDPGAMRAHIMDRDKLYDDDFVIILLDTYGDYQHTYEFCVNPYGIQADLMRTGTNEDDSFDTVWKSAAAMNGHGWTAVMAIPFKSIRFPATNDQVWTVLLARILPRASRALLSWTPNDRNNPCLTCQGGYIVGITGVRSTSSVEMLPYVVGQERGEVGDDTDPTSMFNNGKPGGRVGGGVRYSPSPDLAMEAVVNPDFSQVESDATQISVNSTFALFYSEKRPFFLLGADMFSNQTQTFYSRTINNPLGGARIVGKSGAFSYSYLAALDRNTPYIIPGEEQSDVVSSDVRSFSNIARARYDFGNETYVGGMLTARNSTGAHNYTGGIDWNYKFLGNNAFRGELFLSHTKELNDTLLFTDARQFGSTGHDATFNGESYGGFGSYVALRHDGRDYSANIQYTDRSPTFQAQDGFVPNNDTRILMFNQWYQFYPNNALLDTYGPELDAGIHYNYDGVKKEQWAIPNLNAQFKGQVQANIQYFLVNDELFHDVQFRNVRRTAFNLYSRPSSMLNLNLNLAVGRFINRVDSPSVGTGHTLSLTALVKPSAQFQVELDFTRARLSSVSTGELFFDGYIARTVCVYQFTPELMLRVIGQYDQFNQAIDMYPLLSYKLNPYTIFYAGSTYSLLDYGPQFGTRQTARQYFVKLQYWIRA